MTDSSCQGGYPRKDWAPGGCESPSTRKLQASHQSSASRDIHSDCNLPGRPENVDQPHSRLRPLALGHYQLPHVLDKCLVWRRFYVGLPCPGVFRTGGRVHVGRTRFHSGIPSHVSSENAGHSDAFLWKPNQIPLHQQFLAYSQSDPQYVDQRTFPTPTIGNKCQRVATHFRTRSFRWGRIEGTEDLRLRVSWLELYQSPQPYDIHTRR